MRLIKTDVWSKAIIPSSNRTLSQTNALLTSNTKGIREFQHHSLIYSRGYYCLRQQSQVASLYVTRVRKTRRVFCLYEYTKKHESEKNYKLLYRVANASRINPFMIRRAPPSQNGQPHRRLNHPPGSKTRLCLDFVSTTFRCQERLYLRMSDLLSYQYSSPRSFLGSCKEEVLGGR